MKIYVPPKIGSIIYGGMHFNTYNRLTFPTSFSD